MDVVQQLTLEFVETAFSPVVLATALALGLFARRASHVRAGTALTAAALGAFDAVSFGAVELGAALVLTSALTGLLVAEVALILILPCVAALLGLARRLLLWLRGG